MQLMSQIGGLENPKAKQLGCMMLATSNRLDQLWVKTTPSQVLNWLSKTDGLTVMDKIELLKTLHFHVHNVDAEGRCWLGHGGVGC